MSTHQSTATPSPGRRALKLMVRTAMLGALATVLMYLDFPLGFFVSFLKMDFSDVPALIAGFSLGPAAGVIVQLIKNVFHLMQTKTGGVGELSNFLLSVAMVLPASLVFHGLKKRTGAVTARQVILSLLTGAAAFCLAGCAVNYFIIIPLYSRLYLPLDVIFKMAGDLIPDALENASPMFQIDSLGKLVLWSITPFNVFKSIVVAFLTFWLHKYLCRVLEG